jgi:beta-lactamase regulating signal transducer with metallopeptidase domain
MNLTHALGWTLLHFLWEGALIAFLLAGALAFLRRGSSRSRYAASCAAMVLMLTCASATFLELTHTPTPGSHTATAPLNPNPATDIRGSDGPSLASAVSDYLPALVWAWFGGVIALSIRSLGGWAVAERFARRHTQPAAAIWDEKFAALAKRLRISKPVRLAVSGLAQVPAVVGWMRPIVLVPTSVFTGLTAEQIEALLAHELAHVRRHDYLVNLLQTAAETLFFYHPAMWWVSRKIRDERENCCDDLAVEICGDSMAYVRALTELEQMRRGTPRLAMAADGGSLLNRVQRLLGINPAPGRAPAGWIASIGIAVALLAAGVAASGLAQRPGKAAEAPKPAQQGAPATSTQSPKPSKKAEEKGDSKGWLDEIQSEGYRNLNVDQLIALKIHGVTGEYIRQIRAAGLQLTADQLVAFRIHGVTADFINELKQAGLSNLKADELVALRVHGAEPSWIRQIQALGYPTLTADDVVALRVHGVTPEFIRDAQSHGLKNLSIEKLIQLKRLGILKTSIIVFI